MGCRVWGSGTHRPVASTKSTQVPILPLCCGAARRPVSEVLQSEQGYRQRCKSGRRTPRSPPPLQRRLGSVKNFHPGTDARFWPLTLIHAEFVPNLRCRFCRCAAAQRGGLSQESWGEHQASHQVPWCKNQVPG